MVEAAGIEPASELKKTKKIRTLRFSDGGAEEVRSERVLTIRHGQTICPSC
jgi:hypothetical protein